MKSINLNKALYFGLLLGLAIPLGIVTERSLADPGKGSSKVLTADAQKALTPAEVLQDLKDGNMRFVEGRLTHRDYAAQAAATADGQYPKAAILGCVDSRVPPEIVLDQGIGDVFVGRIAGNFENIDLLGSLEFAAKVAGSKVIVVLGHTHCGAVKGAIDNVELGNLTAMLSNIDPAVDRADERTPGETNSSNWELVDAAVRENVIQTVDDILAGSTVLAEMMENGEVLVVGAVYDLETGRVEWLESTSG